MNHFIRYSALLVICVAIIFLSACTGGGSPNIRYSVGMGYGGYYGHSPYGRYGPDVIIVPDDGPVATQMPEPDMDFGMPDAGFDDFGDFDF